MITHEQYVQWKNRNVEKDSILGNVERRYIGFMQWKMSSQ